MKNRRNTRRGRAKRWRACFSDSGCRSIWWSIKTAWPGTGVYRSNTTGRWVIAHHGPTFVIIRDMSRREAFQVAECIVRGRR